MIRLSLFLVLFWTSVVVSADKQGSFPFQMHTVAVKKMPVTDIFNGTVESIHKATVSAQTGGQIKSIYFDVHDHVGKGDVLLRFRDKEQQNQLLVAKAGLKEAEARSQQAQTEYDRIRKIYQRRLISKKALDKAAAELKSTQARVLSAMARVRRAEERLSYTVVKAPYSGIVTRRHVQVGETARPGTLLMTGLSLEHLRVLTTVPQRLLAVIKQNADASILADGGKTLPINKVIIFPYADPVTHTFKVRLDLKPGAEGLYPGMMVKVAFVTGSKNVLRIPVSTLVVRGEVTAVYLVSGGKLILQQVRVSRPDADGFVTVLAGLKAGDRIAGDTVAATVFIKSSR